MEFFTGQMNLNQLNIIKYNNRPFTTTDEMNDCFINNINKRVAANDKLYIVGNFLFGSLDDEKFLKTARYFRKKINCQNLFLTFGNHDRRMKKNTKFTDLFNYCSDYMEIKTECDTSLILFHYPMLTWNRQKAGAIHLWADQLDTTGVDNSLNIGIDNYKKFFKIDGPEAYVPFSVSEVKTALVYQKRKSLRVENSKD